VLTLINMRQIGASDFTRQENGAVLLRENARKAVLSAWQERKREGILHPFLKEKIEWGLVPHAQALLLARFLRGDLEAYPPFLWK
jgi:CRISPR-associated protein Cas1